MSDPTKAALAKKRLLVFLSVTFALTWGFQIPVGLALGAFENGEQATPAIVAPIAASMFFPLVGALVANRVCGKEGSIDLGLRPRVRENVRAYLVAWFVPAAITLLGGIVFFALRPQLFDPTLTGYLATLQASGAAGSLPSPEEFAESAPMVLAGVIVASLTVAPLVNAIPSFGEEAGWRGMLFPTLCELMPTRTATIVSGVIWGIWHAPVIAMGHNYGMGYLGFPWAGILVMTVACTAFGAFLCALRVQTQSVWPCSIAHGALNAVANTGLVFCLSGQTLAGPTPLGYLAGIPLFALGVYCLLRMPDQS